MLSLRRARASQTRLKRNGEIYLDKQAHSPGTSDRVPPTSRDLGNPPTGRVEPLTYLYPPHPSLSAAVLPYQLLVLFIFSFWMTSIQYPSGSRMKATFFIRPSVRRFFQSTFSSSKRLQAASRSSTETPRDYRQLLYPLIFGDGL